MNVIIVGCGNVGYTLVEKLRDENHNIVVVDQSEDTIDIVTNEQDVLGVVGDGVDYKVLLEAGIEHTDLLIASTDSDEKNLLCCVMAKRSDRYCRTVACVRNPIYNTEISYLRRELGMALIINPELIAAGEISRKFLYPESVQVDTFTRGRIELLHLFIDEGNPLIGQQVGSLNTRKKSQILVCAVSRKHHMIIPGPDFVLQEKDEIIISASPKDATTFFKKIGITKQPLRSAMIVGGGTVGFYLAKRLTDVGVRTKIIESDSDRCMHLNEEIKKAIVIHGDGTDEKLLLREGIGGIGAFAALTGIDEENLLLGFFARRVSHAKSVTKLRRLNYSEALDHIQIDDAVFPALLTADYIVKYARSMSHITEGSAENIFTLKNGRARALEFFISDENEFTGRPLSQLPLREGIIICSITRNERVIVPSGREEIHVGDNILILTTNPDYNELRDMVEL